MSDDDDLVGGYRPLSLRNDLQAMLSICESHRWAYWKSRADVPEVESFLEQVEKIAKAILRVTGDLVSADAFADPPDAFWQQWQTHFNAFEAIWGDWQDRIDRVCKDSPKIPPDVIRQIWTRSQAAEVAAEQATDPPPADLPELRAVWEQVDIDLAYEACSNMIEEAATRTLRLARYVLTAKPGKATLQFLRRVSRCYVWGFDTECVILCRGAIDTGFRDGVADEACSKYEQPAARYGFTLAQRIQTALRSGIITAEAEKAARLVNLRATKSAHDQPGIIEDALGTIRDTLLVLRQLSGAVPDKNRPA